MSAMQSCERAVYTVSVQIPQPHNTTDINRDDKLKTLKVKKRASSFSQWKTMGPALEISQSHTIEHRVSNIVTQRHRQRNKSLAVLWHSAARRHKSIPMCRSHQSVAMLLGRSCIRAWKKHWHSNCRLPVVGGGGTPRPVLLTGAKKAGVPD